MTYAWILGTEQPDTDIQMIKGQAIAGSAIGILVLDLWYPYMPGNVANASTFDFPVLLKILKGSKGKKLVSADDHPALLDMILKAGRELEQQGVRAIVGACGYFANFQREASMSLNVPTFLSSILQVPIVLQGLKPDQKVGIICAIGPSLTPDLLGQCGVDNLSRVVIAGADKGTEWQKLMKSVGHFNSYKIQQELVGLAKELVSKNPDVGAIVLECSDMPPYAWAIQNAVKLPVFDFTSLINWVYHGVVRHPFAGFI